jgi:anaphase-promoting complex subunit 2
MSRVGTTERSTSLKALVAWVDRGVLRDDDGDRFSLLEKAETSAAPRHAVHRPIIDDEPLADNTQQQQAAQMQVYWKVTPRLCGDFLSELIVAACKFIEGMLKNLGQLPIERIQSMLKFAPGYDRTQDHLSAFLEAAQREGLVTFSQGFWKLHR